MPTWSPMTCRVPLLGSEELLPLLTLMLIPLRPPPSELGQALAQAHEASLPCTGFHKRKGLKVKKSMLTQDPL